MTLILCSECKKQVSDKAPTCPHCGHPVVKKESGRRRQIILLVVLGIIFALVAFERYVREPRAAKRENRETLAAQAATQSARLTAVMGGLKTLTGEFTQTPQGGWEFQGDTSLFVNLRYAGDSAVARLVECLDRTERATATVNAEAVSLGALCSHALDRLAYPTSLGEGAESWPGHAPPTAHRAELSAAKEAWQGVLSTGRYKLRPE
jgi:hypothetical protein